ncbi:FkbM family methyltransferase [Ignavibacterium album]|uniref:FkbM family methyltransferase n=1 Tax=Ignavibacterium album TaxID=591197 RepID=UPI0035BAE4F9
MALTLNQKIRSLTYFLTHPQAFKMILSFKESGYLYEVGWFRSLEEKKPVDKDGNPIPWFTYPAIEFIKDRLNKDMIAFEYGCGNSTLFFAERINKIISVETNYDWYNNIKSNLKSNCNLIFYDSNLATYKYHESIKQSASKFDLIIVDAIERNEVIKFAVEYLNKGGVIILDNSDVEEYKTGIEYLMAKGFKKLDFWGIQAAYINVTCTSIFYKPDNCLGI